MEANNNIKLSILWRYIHILQFRKDITCIDILNVTLSELVLRKRSLTTMAWLYPQIKCLPLKTVMTYLQTYLLFTFQR